jgi:hypothetical protein
MRVSILLDDVGATLLGRVQCGGLFTRGVPVPREESAALPPDSRSIDDQAEFVFVDDPDDIPAEATPFDMPGADLSHQRECVR